MTEWAAKRFWTDAAPVPAPGGHGVALDGKPLRTPTRTPVVLPTLALARAVAQEWQAQEGAIDPLAMPLTRCANAALDKVAPQRAAVQGMIAAYGETDLLCYRAASPEELARRQDAAWDPLLDWAEARCGVRLAVTRGVMPIAQPAPALAAFGGEMDRMGDFHIAAFHELVSLSGSFVLGLACVTGHLDADRAWALSRLDELWQADLWGADDEAEALAALKRTAFIQARQFIALADQQD